MCGLFWVGIEFETSRDESPRDEAQFTERRRREGRGARGPGRTATRTTLDRTASRAGERARATCFVCMPAAHRKLVVSRRHVQYSTVPYGTRYCTFRCPEKLCSARPLHASKPTGAFLLAGATVFLLARWTRPRWRWARMSRRALWTPQGKSPIRWHQPSSSGGRLPWHRQVLQRYGTARQRPGCRRHQWPLKLSTASRTALLKAQLTLFIRAS